MKHIKPFNESNVTYQFLTDLREFCEMNLVYLMDDGLTVSVVKSFHLSFVTLRYPLQRGTFGLLVQKDWNDIKDSIIPFFTRLSRQYNVIAFDKLPIGYELGRNEVQFGLRRTTVLNPGLSNGGFRSGGSVNMGQFLYCTLDDVIKDRLDLGNNLIVEIRLCISCNEFNDVIKPVKKSIGSRIKKFLGFDNSHLRQ